MSTSLSFNIQDSAGAYFQYYNNVESTVTDAFNAWTGLFDYTTGAVTINVDFSDLNPKGGSILATGGADSGSTVGTTNSGVGVVASSFATEIYSGTADANQATSATITIDTSYLATAFNPAQPADTFDDRLGVMEHEIGHALGINGFYDPTTHALSDPTFESTFDQYVAFSGGTASLIGPNAEAVYGGAVPLDAGTLYHPYVAGQISVMSYLDQASSIQNLDVAMLQDAGLPILTQQEADEHAVIRLYRAAFARQGDTGGVSYFTNQILNRGASLDDAAAGFIGSAEFQARYGATLTNDAFVNALYLNVLGRAADAGGLAYWGGILQSGDSRANVLNQFAQSDEDRSNLNADPNISYSAGVEGEVLRMYDAAYGRAPDSGGYEYWTKALYGGMDLATLATDFAATPEFIAKYGATLSDTGFVDALYQNTLLRTASSGEEQYWSSLLANGSLTRGQELLDFADSAEHISNVASAASARDSSGFAATTLAILGLIPKQTTQ